MAWTIQIRRGDQLVQHVAGEMYSAIAVACTLLRDGIDVVRIDGPNGVQMSVDAVRPLCGETG